MAKESSRYNTFFDIGVCEDVDKDFGQLICQIYVPKKKKRVINNELVKKFFTNAELTKEELERIKRILDGSIYSDRNKKYAHCQLCSPYFERNDLLKFSEKYIYWNLCIPTFPYFPGGMMIYLKERVSSKIENLQDLSKEMWEELMKIEHDLYNVIKERVLGNKLVGINILFNQLSKSELCIHGHIELMILDINNLELGCKYIQKRPYDKFCEFINKQFFESDALKIQEGIKIPLEKIDIESVKHILCSYETLIKSYFEKGKMLRAKKIDINSEGDQILYFNMLPVAINYVYLTYYNEIFTLSSIPSITSEFVKMDDITDDPIDIYSLSINRNYTGRDNVFMRNFSPLIRPSIKVYNTEFDNTKILKLTKKIVKEVEK